MVVTKYRSGIVNDKLNSTDKARIINKIDSFLDNDDPSQKRTVEKEETGEKLKRWDPAGTCPVCGSQMVWWKMDEYDELYRRCTNYKDRCDYDERNNK